MSERNTGLPYFVFRFRHRRLGSLFTLSVIVFAVLLGCNRPSPPAPGENGSEADRQTQWKSKLEQAPPKIVGQHYVAELPVEVFQFESVFWEPDDTNSLREYLTLKAELSNAAVLEIGTGTGLISLVCLTEGANPVVATDINPAAVLNARYNAEQLELEGLDARLVSAENPTAFSVVQEHEQFDFIISNPPWEPAPVNEPAAYALYDPDFRLLDSLVLEADRYLTPTGKLVLAYGAKTAIHRVLEKGKEHGWQVRTLDDRALEDLPEVFLPGMLLELSKSD